MVIPGRSNSARHDAGRQQVVLQEAIDDVERDRGQCDGQRVAERDERDHTPPMVEPTAGISRRMHQQAEKDRYAARTRPSR